MRALGLAIATSALGACYGPTITESVPCGPGGACPAQLICDRGLCVSTPVRDDAFVPDTVVLADAAVDAPRDAFIPQCGTTVLFTDNFDDTMAAPTFSSAPGSGLVVTESGGHVDFTFAASVAANTYAYYTSATTYTADGLCVAIEISQVPVGGGAAYFKLQSGTSELEFFTSNGMLELRTRNPTLVTRKTLTFDLVAQRFWRIRQQAGTSYWDTAPDGITYVEQTSVPGVFTPTTAALTFGAGAANAVANGGVARFESITARD